MVAGACGLLLVTFWDDISNKIGGNDNAPAEDDPAAQDDPPHVEPNQTEAPEQDRSFSNRLAEALKLGEFRLGQAGPDAASEGDAPRDESPDTSLTGAETSGNGLGEEEDAPAEDTATHLLSPDALDDDSPVTIRNFDPATDVITVQYASTGLLETPDISVAQSEDGQNSEVSVNGEVRGTVEGVGDLQASDVALVDVSQ